MLARVSGVAFFAVITIFFGAITAQAHEFSALQGTNIKDVEKLSKPDAAFGEDFDLGSVKEADMDAFAEVKEANMEGLAEGTDLASIKELDTTTKDLADSEKTAAAKAVNTEASIRYPCVKKYRLCAIVWYRYGRRYIIYHKCCPGLTCKYRRRVYYAKYRLWRYYFYCL